MGAEALDMSLDDLVQGSGGRGRGKGGNKGKGKTLKLWSGSKAAAFDGGAKGRGKGWKKGGKPKDGDDAKEGGGKKDSFAKLGDAKMDMSLDDVIVKSKGNGKSKGPKNWGNDGENKGKGRGAGKGKRTEWYEDSYKGRGYKGGNKGWKDEDSYAPRKGSFKSAGKGGRGADYDRDGPNWNQHDDRGDDEDSGKGKGRREESWGGAGKGGRRGSSFESPVRGRGEKKPLGLGGRSAVAKTARGDDGWQRVEQQRAPIRDSRRDEPPTRRREVSPRRPVRREAERPAPQKRRADPDARSPPTKRRATEDVVDSRTARSVKVTNIPSDVNMNDIKEAFEQETGKIVRCRIDHGTAWIAFSRSSDARKAVDTFDRGELNGQTIGVVLDA